MIPQRIFERFGTVPDELIGLCRPHTWAQLTAPPGEGMKSIRSVLVHLAGVEAFWIQHVVLARPRMKPREEDLADLDAILDIWKPQRETTMRFVRALTPEQRAEKKAFPWNPQEHATVEDIVWHVVSHEQYHRGQIFTRLALLGRRDLPDHDMLR